MDSSNEEQLEEIRRLYPQEKVFYTTSPYLPVYDSFKQKIVQSTYVFDARLVTAAVAQHLQSRRNNVEAVKQRNGEYASIAVQDVNELQEILHFLELRPVGQMSSISWKPFTAHEDDIRKEVKEYYDCLLRKKHIEPPVLPFSKDIQMWFCLSGLIMPMLFDLVLCSACGAAYSATECIQSGWHTTWALGDQVTCPEHHCLYAKETLQLFTTQ